MVGPLFLLNILLDGDTRSRAAAFFPVPAQYIRQIKPASQWGINE
jgi:hypothetical protein